MHSFLSRDINDRLLLTMTVAVVVGGSSSGGSMCVSSSFDFAGIRLFTSFVFRMWLAFLGQSFTSHIFYRAKFVDKCY